MAVSKTSGTKFYIGPVVDVNAIQALSDVDAVAFFEAISGGEWTEVEEIENYGEHGDTSDVASFASVSDRRMRKFKTTRDAGTMALTVGRDPLDDGQIALVAAEKTDFNYAFKIEYADARTDDYTDSIDYFGGMVMSRPVNVGGVKDITKRTFSIGVNTAIYEVPSASSVVPANLTLPSIVGTQVRVGYTLTAIEGEWSGEPTSYTYQWQHDVSGNGTFGNVSVGGTSRTYVPVVGDIADCLRVVVTAHNGAGASSAANSLGTTAIIAA